MIVKIIYLYLSFLQYQFALWRNNTPVSLHMCYMWIYENWFLIHILEWIKGVSYKDSV